MTRDKEPADLDAGINEKVTEHPKHPHAKTLISMPGF